MFWATSLKQGSTCNLAQHKEKGELLHLSQTILHPNGPEGLHTIFVTVEGKKYPLANLDKKSKDSSSVDLYFHAASAPVFSVQGPGEVSLLGYFEPEEAEHKHAHEKESEEESEEDISEEEEEEEEELPAPKVSNGKLQAKQPEKAQEKPKKKEDSESEESEEEEEEEEEVGEEESQDEESDEEESDESQEDLPRKRESASPTGKPSKLQKTPEGKGAASNQNTPKQQTPQPKQTPGKQEQKQTPQTKQNTPKQQTPAQKPQTPQGKPSASKGTPQQSGKKEHKH